MLADGLIGVRKEKATIKKSNFIKSKYLRKKQFPKK